MSTHPPDASPAADTAGARDDNEDLLSLIELDAQPDGRLTSRLLRGNQNGRVFGGQMLAQAVSASSHGMDRPLTALQLLFLHSASTTQPMLHTVSTLQQGRRFTSRHVRTLQGDRIIADAHATFQVPAEGVEHQAEPPAVPPPESLKTLDDWDAEIARTRPEGAYLLQQKRCLDLRLVDAERFLQQPSPQPQLRYWLKARHALPDAQALHTAALAYMSDYWLNHAGIVRHWPVVGSRDRLYASSLNHSLWVHAPFRADDWLLFDVDSPRAAGLRTLNIARVFDRGGRLVASASQEGLITAREAGDAG